MYNSYLLFSNKALKNELINKFSYLNLAKLPKIKKIILTFKLNVFSLKMLAVHFLILQNIVEAKKGTIIKARKANILIKIKKGNPVGCKISLTNNKKIFLFLNKFLNELFVLGSLKYNLKNNYFSTRLDDIFLVSKENFFNNLTGVTKQKLSVTVYCSGKSSEIAYTFRNMNCFA